MAVTWSFSSCFSKYMFITSYFNNENRFQVQKIWYCIGLVWYFTWRRQIYQRKLNALNIFWKYKLKYQYIEFLLKFKIKFKIVPYRCFKVLSLVTKLIRCLDKLGLSSAKLRAQLASPDSSIHLSPSLYL